MAIPNFEYHSTNTTKVCVAEKPMQLFLEREYSKVINYFIQFDIFQQVHSRLTLLYGPGLGKMEFPDTSKMKTLAYSNIKD